MCRASIGQSYTIALLQATFFPFILISNSVIYWEMNWVYFVVVSFNQVSVDQLGQALRDLFVVKKQ